MKTFKAFRQIQEAKMCPECGCDMKNPKKDCDCDHKAMNEEPMDGVAKGSLPDNQHMCATKIFKEGLGEGTPILGEHAIPDEDGKISWYKVMFEHGVFTVDVDDAGVEILMQEAHGNHKKKMKEEVEEIEEISKKTLGSYIKKATTSYGAREKMSKEYERDAKETSSGTEKNVNTRLAGAFQKGAEKRKAGIMKATDKLVNK